jgi:predicted dehydrogenase
MTPLNRAHHRTRVGLVGCGAWGRNVLRDLAALACEVHVADPAAAARAAAVAAGAASAGADLGALPPVAGIVVATPAATHAAVVARLLERGVPLFVEKPLTTDADAAAQLAAAAPDRLFVMHNWRYHRGIEALAAIASARELGEVRCLRTTRANWTSPRRDVDAVWTLAPHDVSIALAVLGEIPAPRFAVAEVDGGRAVGLVGILGERPCVVIETSTRVPDKRREVRLHCERGVAVLPHGESDHVLVATGVDGVTPRLERRAIPVAPPLARELAEFVAFLGGGPPPRCSAAEGAAVVQAVAVLRRLAGLDAGSGSA